MAQKKRLTVPLDDNLYLEIKVKAVVLGLPMTEIMRRLIIAWLRDEVALPIYSGDVFDGGRIVGRDNE